LGDQAVLWTGFSFRHSSRKVPESTAIADNPGASARISAARLHYKVPANQPVLAPNVARERALCKQEVTGSIPVGSTELFGAQTTGTPTW
jgi:hypothetical protein